MKRRASQIYGQMIALALFFLLVPKSVMAADPKDLCWHDYPISTPSINYEKVFAGGTLAPDKVVVNGKSIKSGMTEAAIMDLLGSGPTVLEDLASRNEQEQCEYLLEVLRKHPDSMHLYILGGLKLRKMSGFFRVSEWQFPRVGVIRAFFYRPSENGPEATYLYHLTLLPTSPSNVHRKKGEGYLLVRKGPPQVQWDIQTNQVKIDGLPSRPLPNKALKGTAEAPIFIQSSVGRPLVVVVSFSFLCRSITTCALQGLRFKQRKKHYSTFLVL